MLSDILFGFRIWMDLCDADKIIILSFFKQDRKKRKMIYLIDDIRESSYRILILDQYTYNRNSDANHAYIFTRSFLLYFFESNLNIACSFSFCAFVLEKTKIFH